MVLSSLPLLLLFALPLLLSLVFVLPGFFEPQGFAALFAHPQFWGALKLSVFSGVVSTLLSLILALLILRHSQYQLAPTAGAFLAVPHLSLALALGFFIMPTGALARVIAVFFTGWETPPQWVTTQDPAALALTAALVLKETPFLVWVFASLLNRDDLNQMFAGQRAAARSLGHTDGSIFWRGLVPQMLPKAAAPLIAVLAYGLTVVDMALVIGPTQPPTLAQLIWTDLNDSEPASNARGTAGVLCLCLLILLLLLVVGLLLRLARPYVRGFYSGYPPTRKDRNVFLGQIWGFWRVFYGVVGILLLVQSFSGYWPFPDLLPSIWTTKSWSRLFSDGTPLLTSFALATSTSLAALMACVLWLEVVSPRHDRFMLILCTLSFCLPALLIGLGQYRLFLSLDVTGTAAALFFAHVLPVSAYVFILLQGPYRSFDSRWASSSAGLGIKHSRFLIEIKWPLLKSSLLSALAVGFAVSIAQYVPAQLAAAGRFSTLPMEAVTLTAGGNRSLIATYGLALTALPLLMFLAAGRMGRPRWSIS